MIAAAPRPAASRCGCLLAVCVLAAVDSVGAEFTCPPAFYKRHATLIPIANGQVYIPVFRFVKKDLKDPSEISLAMVVLHGAGQNSDNYFGWVVNSELGNNQKDNTVVIMPAFPDFSCNASDWTGNENQTGETLRWSGSAWKYGQLSDQMPTVPRMSSFQVVDEVIQYLQMEYLSLRRIDVLGYSAGADMALVWAILSSNGYRNVTNGGVRMRVLLGSPNTYLYLNDRRPALACDAFASSAGSPVQQCEEFLVPGSGSLAAEACSEYNRFPFGLDGIGRAPPGITDAAGASSNYLHGYMDEGMAKAELPAHFAMKDVIFMIGSEDADSCESDAACRGTKGCQAMVQGKSRLQRGLSYVGHLRDALPGYEPKLRIFSGSSKPEEFFQNSVWAESAFGDIPSDPSQRLSLKALFSSGFFAIWICLCLSGCTCLAVMVVVVCRQPEDDKNMENNYEDFQEGDTEEEDEEGQHEGA